MSEEIKKDLEDPKDPKDPVEPKDDDEELDKEVKNLTSKIEKNLGLDKIKTMIEAIKNIKKDTTLMTKIFGKEDVTKDDVNALTKEQKIVGFFTALVQKDRVALKALSEGTSADGGYLVPTEFRTELIRDLEEPNTMRSLVRVVPMLRLSMDIPSLTAKPKVYWTAENTQKTTTSAEFYKKTLIAYKVAAISLQSGFALRSALKNAINSVKTLLRATPSQALSSLT